MPVLTTCKTCGFEGYHGFVDAFLGVIHFYHGDSENNCLGFWEGSSGCYPSAILSFEAEWGNRPAPKGEEQSYLVWCDAMRSRLTGNERKAKRLFATWSRIRDVEWENKTP